MRHAASNTSFFKRLKLKILRLLRLDANPTLRLYKGFGNREECNIYGHALSLAPLARKRYRNVVLYNTAALLRLFMVKPVKQARIELHWGNERYEVLTADDGFFHFQWKPLQAFEPGNHPVRANWLHRVDDTVIASAESDITIPSPADYAVISDIDDTFLISHSGNLRKRLLVLFTHNARSRRPFEGVVRHYQLLRSNNRLFFYVSSSEWNLYDYIREFIRTQQLPDGIFLLNQIKTFSKIFSTGQGKHTGKFTRIVRIIEAYPDQQFILLGDDSQRDPEIYAEVVAHFPQNIHAVYIRKLQAAEKPAVLGKKRSIESAGVQFCYFYHSDEAIEHSLKIGLFELPGGQK